MDQKWALLNVEWSLASDHTWQYINFFKSSIFYEFKCIFISYFYDFGGKDLDLLYKEEIRIVLSI